MFCKSFAKQNKFKIDYSLNTAMAKIKVLKMGSFCKDVPTDSEGMLTHFHYDMSGQVTYIFQPRKINPKTGHPVEPLKVDAGRLGLINENWTEVDLPTEVLGSIVTEKATGFSGVAVGIIVHTNGCVHLYIQPDEVLPETNTFVRALEIDIRRCTGEKIPVLSAEEQVASEKKTPSPNGEFGDVIPSPTRMSFP